MKFTTPFAALRNATADMWRMHDFNYQLPQKDLKKLNYIAIGVILVYLYSALTL